MFYPIGDENVQGGSFPIATYTLISINILVFFFEASLGEPAITNFINNFGAIPSEITSGQNLHSLFTCMFLHGGWAHLIGNMLFLWIFADNIEATIGTPRFTLFYILGGLIAALAHIAFDLDGTIPMVGASGAIAAVMGAYIVMYPQSRIKIIFILFFFRPFYIPALLFLGVWILQQLTSGVGSLAETAETAGVAWWAHIGGFVFGVLAGFYFRRIQTQKFAIA